MSLYSSMANQRGSYTWRRGGFLFCFIHVIIKYVLYEVLYEKEVRTFITSE